MITRVFVIFQFGVYFNNLIEFYPTSIKFVAFGLSAFFASISSVIVQIVMTDIGEDGISPFLILGLFSGLISIAYCGVPETLNCKIKDQIEEI